MVDDQTPRDQLRAGDADRERVAERLRSAHVEGRLDLTEYDERVQRAWAARTYGELARLTGDLPHGGAEQASYRPQPAMGDSAASGWSRRRVGRRRDRYRQDRYGRAAVGTWLTVSLVNLVIWAVVSLSTLSWIYPWWIWIAGPWGAVLLAGWITQRWDGQRSPG